jgi:hypothetical protein
MDSLRLTVLTPHAPAQGCRCRECFGLAEFMLQVTGNAHGLPRAPGHNTAPEPQKATLRPVEACNGTMVCECQRCAQERSERVRRPPKQPKQPWEAKAA